MSMNSQNISDMIRQNLNRESGGTTDGKRTNSGKEKHPLNKNLTYNEYLGKPTDDGETPKPYRKDKSFGSSEDDV